MKRFRRLIRDPIEGVLFVFSVGLLGIGLWILSPWYVTLTYASPLTITFVQRAQEYAVGAILTVCGMPGTISPLIPEEKKQGWLRRGAFMVFLAFLFLSILRVLVIGWLPISWLPLLLIALSSGVLRLSLEAPKT